MKKSLFVLAFCFCLAAANIVWAAPADIQFSYSGPGLDVNGVLQGIDNANGSYTITSATGEYNGSSISLVPAGDPTAGGLFNYDNIVYLPAGPYYVDYLGLVFDVAGRGLTNFCGSSACAGAPYTDINAFNGYGFTNVDTVSFSLLPATDPPPIVASSAVSEPGTLLMFGSGLLGLAGVLHRKLA